MKIHINKDALKASGQNILVSAGVTFAANIIIESMCITVDLIKKRRGDK